MNREAFDRRPVVVIAGGAGLIGRAVIGALQDAYRVIALDIRKPSGGFADGVTFFRCDLTTEASTNQAFDAIHEQFGGHLASVIHLAAHHNFSGHPSRLYEKLTVEGTRFLLRILTRNFEVEQFVFASTLLVMKPATAGRQLDEASELAAEWDYPASMIRAEAAIEAERGEMPAVILRLAGVYDEGGHSLPIAQQVWRIRERKLESHFFPGNAERGQSFVHLNDVATCFRRVVDARVTLGNDLFLIGEPETYSYSTLQERIGELIHGKRWGAIRIPAVLAKVSAWLKNQLGEEFIKPWMIDLADAHYPISIEHARARLGWEPAHRLIDTLPDMIEELDRDPVAWYAENDLPFEAPEELRNPDVRGLHAG